MIDYSPAVLRVRFAQLADFSWDSDWPRQERQVSAAVLIPLLLRSGVVHVLLTRRTDHLNHHAGQISFPGGRMEDADASLSATALREAQEEVGLDPAAVEVLGVLPEFGTPSGFCITPVVGLVQAETRLQLDPFEVAEAFEIPLHFLASLANYQRHRINWQGGERHVLAVPYPGRFIWGATAGILHMLAKFLQA